MKVRMKDLIITRRTDASGHTLVMVEIKGRIYAATYAPGSDVTDTIILADLRRYGYGARTHKGFRPYDQSRGCYL